MSFPPRRLPLASALLPLLAALARPARADDSAQSLLVAEVWPVLSARCFECHGPELAKVKGGLRFDSAESLRRGGASGPAVDAKRWQDSLFVRAIRRVDPDLAMPPRTPLAPEERALLERWVEAGLPWPAAAPAEAAELQHFEQRVRPLLIERCFGCHGPELAAPKGGLAFAGRESLLRGGEHGPALLPGDAATSLLARAVRYEHPDLHMPPTRRLAREEVVDIERWIRAGAPWPGGSAPAAPSAAAPAIDWQSAREWWSFRPIARPEPPREAGRDAQPIDAFLDARLAAAGIEANPEASPRELVRRAYLDLLGLPPTLAEVQAFESDRAPRAWERLVDALLERPEYGERMARAWLDVVRYAQTNGYERDAEKPFAWRYRDWVIDAFQRDEPYDAFVRAQIAGDEIAGPRSEAAIGTGLYRIGPWDDEPDDAEQAVHDELDDIVRVIGEGFLGLTVGCARCHDHKFDPITQEDYYGLVAYVRNLTPYAPPEFSGKSGTLAPIGADYEQVRAWHEQADAHRAELVAERAQLLARARAARAEQQLADLPAEVRQAFARPEPERNPAQRAAVAQHAAREFSDVDALDSLPAQEHRRAIYIELELSGGGGQFAGQLRWALVARQREQPLPTHVLIRGRASSPGAQVEAAVPRVLRAQPPRPDGDAPGAGAQPLDARGRTGTRRALTEWIASPDNPLFARVWANRIWKQHFGRGLAPTVSDFGRSGQPPTHPELLDWLASELVAQGWSTKALHRRIMSSAAYRRSSRASAAGALARDAANTLLWRQNAQRLDAESVHDGLLRAAGELDSKRGGRGYFCELSREVLGGASRPGEGWEPSPPQQRARRAIYAFAKRGVRPALIESFDGADPFLSIGQRASTTTATQALVLLNGDFSAEQAAAAARRVRAQLPLASGAPLPAAAELEPLARAAFERVLARTPGAQEQRLAAELLASQAQAFAKVPACLSFRSRVPARLSRAFLRLASGADLQYGPPRDWSFATGVWGHPYNDTLEPELDRGPAALWTGAPAGVPLDELVLRAELCVRPGNEIASIYLQARAVESWIEGLELRFEAPAGRLGLWRSGAEAERLAEAPIELAAGRFEPLRIELAGPRVAVWLGAGAAPVLELVDERVRGAGSLAARAIGEGFDLARAQLELPGAPLIDLCAVAAADPLELALESLCLALFNTNEFLYRD